MICPCGCKNTVPHGRFWFSDQCRRRGNKLGIKMPSSRSSMEKSIHKSRTRYTPKEGSRLGIKHSPESKWRISISMKEYYKSKSKFLKNRGQ